MAAIGFFAASTVVPLWAAVATGVVAVLLFYLTRSKEQQARRRETYSEAFKAALEWREAVYRVRRRAADGSEDRALVGRFHDLQERLDYYEGVLTLEHQALGDAFSAFVKAVKQVCEPLLQDAWQHTGRDPATPAPADEVHLDAALSTSKKAFLELARKHLNQPWDIGSST